jgi:tetratricopeptide (TPR) repeat protein
MNSKQKSFPNGNARQPHGLASRLVAGNLLCAAALAIISAAIYYNSLSNGFVFDDYGVIVENKHINDFRNSLPSFFNDSYFKIAGGEASYRPIATLSYFLIHSFAGLNPFYYHLASVVLHTLNVILVYVLISLLLKDRFKALLAALLFACHPVLTEAVDCIAFNEDLLAAFFILLAFILYVKAVDKRPAGSAHLLSLFFFFCSLLSKEMAISLPALILLYDLAFREAAERGLSVKHILTTIKIRWSFYTGYALVAGLYLLLRFAIFVNPADGNKHHFGSLLERLLYLPYHIFSFFKLAIAPYDLNVDYVYSYPHGFFEISNLIGFVIISGLVVLSFFIYKRSKEIFFGIWWFLIALFPVYNIIEISYPLAERYLYTPIIGFCLILPIILYRIFSNIRNRTLFVRMAALLVIIAVSAAYSTIAIGRNKDFKDDFSLWSKTVVQSPNSANAHGGLGHAYHKRGQLDKAIVEFQKAVRILPNHFRAYYILGVLYDQKGDIKNAIDNYKKSIAINPEFADAQYNLAILYHKQGLIADAIRQYKKVIELMPEDYEAHNDLGVAYAIEGQLLQAVSEWQKVLKIDPANKSARDNISKAKAQLEKSN